MTDVTAEQILGQIEELKARLPAQVARINDGAQNDTGRKQAGEEGVADITAQIVAASQALAARSQADEKAARKAEIEEAVKAVLHDTRSASLNIGSGQVAATSRMKAQGGREPHPALKAIFNDYAAGELLESIMDVKGIGMGGIDVERIAQGKASLQALGVVWDGVPSESKATLGTTGATGGYVLPNNLVDQVIKPTTQEAVYTNLVTVRGGVNVRGVDQPYRSSAAQIAVFQPWGNAKSNLNETYGSYTANLGTLALVYDISKQYARFSAGSAEQDVMDELTRGFYLAENKAILAGAGTVNTGTGDPTVGIYTALNGAINSAYATSFSPVATTQAGAAASGFTKMMGDLASRSRVPSAIVLDAVTYFTIVGQGTDTAGFWVSPTGGPTGFTRTDSGQVSFWGVPMYWDANYNTNTGTTKGCIMGDFKQAKLYRGLEFRIDTSDVAGSRWDNNLIGFRGEEEIGINATAAVYVGAFQLCTSIIA